MLDGRMRTALILPPSSCTDEHQTSACGFGTLRCSVKIRHSYYRNEILRAYSAQTGHRFCSKAATQNASNQPTELSKANWVVPVCSSRLDRLQSWVRLGAGLGAFSLFERLLPTLSRRPRPTAIRWSNRMTAPSGSHRCKRKKVYSSTCALS
jgi:hypothetical protein